MLRPEHGYKQGTCVQGYLAHKKPVQGYLSHKKATIRWWEGQVREGLREGSGVQLWDQVRSLSHASSLSLSRPRSLSPLYLSLSLSLSLALARALSLSRE